MAGDDKYDLTGVWDGEYSYARRFSPTRFTAVIIELDERFSGSVNETPPDGPGAGKARSALIEGARADLSVAFMKTYEVAKGAFQNPVRYQGVLDAEGVQITGTWTINAGSAGRFVMTRPQRRAEQAKAKRKALVPAG